MTRFRWQTIEGAHVREEGKFATLSPDLETRVAEEWAAEQESRNVALVDSPIFSVTRIAPDGVVGHFVPYRHFVAQLRVPELREILRVQPLGVSAITRVGDALVFGRRSPHTTQDPDCWELVPAGGVGIEARAGDGTIDPARQLALELAEELGVPAREIRGRVPFALVVDLEARVHDLVFAVDLAADRRAVEEYFAARSSREVAEIEIASAAEMKSRLRREGGELAPITHTLLEADAQRTRSD